jgi:hypothetical protein
MAAVAAMAIDPDEGEMNEESCADHRRDCRGCRTVGLRDNAQDADVPGRVGCWDQRSLPAAAAASASAAATSGDLRGWHNSSGRLGLPAATSSAAAAAAGAPFRRAWINLTGPAQAPAPLLALARWHPVSSVPALIAGRSQSAMEITRRCCDGPLERWRGGEGDGRQAN